MSMEVEEKEEMEEDNFHGAPPDAKWSEDDLVVLEDTRVGKSSKVFWESLAVVLYEMNVHVPKYSLNTNNILNTTNN